MLVVLKSVFRATIQEYDLSKGFLRLFTVGTKGNNLKTGLIVADAYKSRNSKL